ncbi:MAG: serpin family protein [Bacteroidaceae bacterium]|nr:serpin family protein [Bacteroidaceae bacterium]
MNKRNITFALLTALLVSCNLDNEIEEPTPTIDPVYPPADLVLTKSELQMVQQSNTFAFNLFNQISDTTAWESDIKTKSFMVSPLSITYALGMLNNGAAGNTQAQINNVLGFGQTGADSINAFCYKMLQAAPALDSLTKVLIANNIYLNQGFEIKPEFQKKANDFYDAQPETRNFADGETMDVINQWASDHTEHMIDTVLTEDEFDERADYYMLNALYFKGEWTTKFDKAKTKEASFSTPGRKTVMVPMMNLQAEFEYSQNNDYQAIRLPYGNGSYYMTVLLPKAFNGDLPALPSAQAWKELNRNMEKTLIDLSMPRIETDTDIDLSDIMKGLGMTDAFNRAADFSELSVVWTYIFLFKQVAKIKLDEEGTEAAAVTVIGGKRSDSTPKFTANHPFIYLISEKNSDAIFFMGRFTGE